MSTKTIKTWAAIGTLAIAGAAFAENGDSADAAVGSLKPNTGHGICTAAINSDGTVAGGQNVSKSNTQRFNTGTYGVRFFGPCADIRAAKGYMRFIQIDTLTTGSLNSRVCTTADLAGQKSGVFISCKDNAGEPVDTSFMLMVTR